MVMNAAELRKSGKWDFFLLRLRYREGRIVEVAGNEPIILDDAATAWIVYAGEIDVFWVPVENSTPIGARHHLFRAEEGTGLFGIAPDQVGLLANGAPGSQLLKVRRSTLEEMSNEPDFIDSLAFVVDSWIGGLSSGITHQLVPREFKVLESQQEAVLDAGEIAHTRKGVLWLRHLEGISKYTGRSGIASMGSNDVVPISPHTWVEATEVTRLAAVDTQAALEQDTLWPDLARFHRLVLECIADNAAQTANAEYQRLESRNTADLARTDAALSQLASVLHTESNSHFVSVDRQAPLLTACQLVARELGSSIHLPAGIRIDAVNGNQRDAVRRIAQVARMRTRQVGLRGEWWRTESGPLLGYLESLENEPPRPVALLPESTRGYTLHDPVAQTATPVNAEIAASLSQFATMFYRPFPAKSLSVGEIMRFGLHGTRRDLVAIAMMAVVAGLLGTLAPVLTGIIFDRILPSAQRSQLLQVALVLFVSAVSVVLFQVTRSIALLRIEGKMEASIQAAVVDRLLDLPATFFRSYSAGDLGIRALGISAIRQILSRVALSAIFAGLTSLFSLGLLFVYDRQLAGIAVLLAVIYVGIVIAISYVQVRYERRLADIQGKIAGTVLQFINGIAKFRVAGAERRAFAHWAQQFTEQRKLAYKARTVGNGLAAFSSGFSLLTSMVIFGMIILASGENRLTTGSFLAFNFAFSQFLVSALSLGGAFTATLRVVPMFERARPIFQTLPEVDETKDDPGELGGEIEINSVSFRYTPDGPVVLNDVSLHVEPGQFVAFVGPSGSGKSTVLRLLLGFERPESGAIFYDGQDLTALDIHAVRRQIGTVLQSSRLMTGDILTNIVGTSGLTIDDAWEAARMAGLEGDIQAMPMGMHTVVSEGGTTLSGGQRQRLMIARAIVNKPRIIFFDEATSALDNRTQEIVSNSLQNLEATRVVIAHRLSTIMHADQIFVIDGGRVVQSGRYNDLLNQPGLFSDLARRQLI